MTSEIKLYLRWIVTFITIVFTLASEETNAQEKLSKKQRKKQEKEALADRLFVEGQKFLMLEEYDRAYFYFEKALVYNPNQAAIHFKLAEILTRANQLDEALAYAEKAMEHDPSNKYYKLMIAEIYSKQKKPAEAAEILHSLMKDDESNQQYILELASLYLTSQEFDKALVALEQAEEYYGVVEQLTAQKQRIHLRNNDLESAVAEGKKLIDAHPGNAQYVLALVEILFNNNKLDDALKVVETSLETFPDQPELFMALYTLNKEKQQITLAHDYIRKAFAHSELDVEIKVRAFSEILHELKTEARDALLEELASSLREIHPMDAHALSALGDYTQLKGDKEKAIDYYQKAISIQPANEPVLQTAIALMFEMQVDFAEIEKMTQIAIDEFPEKPEFWFFDGAAKLAQKNYEGAGEALETSLKLNNGDNKQLEMLILSQLGDGYHYLGKKEEAFKAYERVLEINPNNEHILNNYAYFLSLEKKELEKAKRMSEKLVKKFPKNPTYLDTYAWVLFQQGDFEEAKKYMERALEHQTEPSGVMYEHFGDILYKLGNEKDALSYWKKAQGLEETSEFLSDKIKNGKYYE